MLKHAKSPVCFFNVLNFEVIHFHCHLVAVMLSPIKLNKKSLSVCPTNKNHIKSVPIMPLYLLISSLWHTGSDLDFSVLETNEVALHFPSPLMHSPECFTQNAWQICGVLFCIFLDFGRKEKQEMRGEKKLSL